LRFDIAAPGGRRAIHIAVSLSFFFAVFFSLSPSISLAMDESYLRELVNRAHEKRLWERREWKILLHCKPRIFKPGFKSLVDAESFFLAPDGKTDPEREM
jgi:hypothetical protein